MKLLKNISIFLERWKLNSIATKFDAGYGWAMTAYFVDNKSIEEILQYVKDSEIFCEYGPFDDGILQAVDKISEIIQLQGRSAVAAYCASDVSLANAAQYKLLRTALQGTVDHWRDKKYSSQRECVTGLNSLLARLEQILAGGIRRI